MNIEIDNKQAEILSLKTYLNNTDYVAIRAFETGVKEDEEILSKRAAARERINTLEAEIVELQELEAFEQEIQELPE